MAAIGREDLGEDPKLASNPGRVEAQAEIDAAIAQWTGRHTAHAVMAALDEAEVPVGLIYSVADMKEDPHYQARGMFETVETPQGVLEIPAILPRLEGTPGRTEHAGPDVGVDTEEVLGGLGFESDELARLRDAGDI